MNNIYLIGMPGCGKSTIGNILSNDLGLCHIDADIYLEQKFSKTISEIFEFEGEEAFRIMETETIKELSSVDNIIVSTGGGVVTKKDNKLLMKNTGKIYFIDASPQTILNNSSLRGRPLLKDKMKIFDLYKSRIAMYRDFADIIIDNNGLIDNTVKTIKESLGRND